MKKILFLLALLIPVSAAAQVPSASNEPVEISAKHSLEWNRKDKTYTAREDAVAKQGITQISSGTLTAHYRDGTGGGTDIYELDAVNNVVISSPPYSAYGDKAVYDVPGNRAALTGQNLRIETPTEKLTARDKIEFFGKENRMNALGGAVATRGTDTLKANTMSAFFTKGPDGKTALNKMTADGAVVITTAKETVYGDKGLYDVPSQRAWLTGKVKILQGDNWLEGTKAEVNLVTGVSQLYGTGNAATEGRVKGIFYPKGKAAADAAAAAKAAQKPAMVPQAAAPVATVPATGVAPIAPAPADRIISFPPARDNVTTGTVP